MIFHITTQAHWDELSNHHSYAPVAFAKENFIHCCEAHQVEGVLSRYFKGAENLLMLHLDETKLKAPLQYEAGTNNELFPHVYGEINKEAIMRIQKI